MTETHRENQTALERAARSDRKREKEKKEEEADRWERSMGNKSSSNHDRNQM